MHVNNLFRIVSVVFYIKHYIMTIHIKRLCKPTMMVVVTNEMKPINYKNKIENLQLQHQGRLALWFGDLVPNTDKWKAPTDLCKWMSQIYPEHTIP